MRRTAFLALVLALWLPVPSGQAEYGDVVINRYSDAAGERPVVFQHWFHRVRFRCKVCHAELGMEMRAGASEMTMRDIVNGRFCGACHNDVIAWGPDNCELCHTGIPGTPTGVYGGDKTLGPGRL